MVLHIINSSFSKKKYYFKKCERSFNFPLFSTPQNLTFPLLQTPKQSLKNTKKMRVHCSHVYSARYMTFLFYFLS